MNARDARVSVPPRPVPLAGFESIQCNWSAGVGKWVARILPGEFYIARSGEAITTVLGSCVAACMRDPALGIGGMNHFMLPQDMMRGGSSWPIGATGQATRYGLPAMESLMNGLLKLGARHEHLEVKLFGGGRVLDAASNIGERNIAFVRCWLQLEGLSIVAEDVGDVVPRRVIYLPASGRVRVRHLRAFESGEVV